MSYNLHNFETPNNSSSIKSYHHQHRCHQRHRDRYACCGYDLFPRHAAGSISSVVREMFAFLNPYANSRRRKFGGVIGKHGSTAKIRGRLQQEEVKLQAKQITHKSFAAVAAGAEDHNKQSNVFTLSGAEKPYCAPP